MKKIIFVCAGNTCRSPMAEAIFNALVSRDPLLAGRYEAVSEGISAIPGSSASKDSIIVLKNDYGIDITAHESRILNRYELDKAELILTMELSHKNFMIRAMPELKDKVFALKEYVGEAGDLNVKDPYSHSFECYRQCASEIKRALDKLVKKLRTQYEPL